MLYQLSYLGIHPGQPVDAKEQGIGKSTDFIGGLPALVQPHPAMQVTGPTGQCAEPGHEGNLTPRSAFAFETREIAMSDAIDNLKSLHTALVDSRVMSRRWRMQKTQASRRCCAT